MNRNLNGVARTTGPLHTDGAKNVCSECLRSMPSSWRDHYTPASADVTTCDACQRITTEPEDITTEAVAEAILRLISNNPGKLRRIEAARIISEYPPARRGRWPLREFVALVDALRDGGLMLEAADGTLALTQGGQHALDHLEAAAEEPAR